MTIKNKWQREHLVALLKFLTLNDTLFCPHKIYGNNVEISSDLVSNEVWRKIFLEEKGLAVILGIIKWHVIKHKKVLKEKITGSRPITNYTFGPKMYFISSKNVLH